MKIKIGNNVKVISGKEKGKTGIVKHIFRKKNSVIIENINIKTKHIKPKQTEEKGCIKQIEGYINFSNIKIIN
uniref:Large ribosomal subunit protein uL24c n=1 Tax=Lophocladia kuetzingii TaxID=675577 RepID=A0A1Z1MNS4_9FLOR|nr:ribosomal protein L24 [Lophocladia kuetzingii]ARW67708.1 ribosomal protein L24 [Lophocladia kuetzingii]